jgi:hypothetical protein
MLAGMNHGGLELVRPLAQRVNYQRQFNCFRPRAEDRDNSTLHEDRLPFLAA